MPSLEGCAQVHILSKSFLSFVKIVWIKIDEDTDGLIMSNCPDLGPTGANSVR